MIEKTKKTQKQKQKNHDITNDALKTKISSLYKRCF